MKTEKKAMSGIILTIIMIALVLVAIAIVWAVVQNLIEENVDQTNYQADCLQITLGVEASCTSANACTATFNRKAGGGAMGGIKVKFGDGTVLDSKDSTANLAGEFTNIPELNSDTFTTAAAGATTTPTTIAYTVYLTDSAGADQLCQTVTLNL